MAISGKLGAVYAPVVDENNDLLVLEGVSDTFTDNTDEDTFQLANEYVFPKSETVTVGGDTTHRYNLNYITGELVLNEATSEDVEVTYDALDEDGEGNKLEQIAGFYEWEFEEEANLEESPEFGDEVITHTQTLESWSGSADRYHSESRFEDWLGQQVVLGFYINTETGERFEGWGRIGDKSVETPVDTLVEEDISFEGESRLEYRE